MPQPPSLPQLDWCAIFHSGIPWRDWIETGEHPDKREKMKTAAEAQPLDDLDRALLAALPREVYVVAIAEDWCGDVVLHVPVLARMAAEAPRLHVRYITRAQHPDVFVRYLTNGGEAIPKFVFLSAQWVECGNWGPMPAWHKQTIARGKACGDVAAARKIVSARYDADPERRETLHELMHLLRIAVAPMP